MQNLINLFKDFRAKSHRSHFSFYIYCAFFSIALFNPFFQKYDYGAGFPIVMLFSGVLLVFLLAEFKEKREKAFLEKFFLSIFGISLIISFYFSSTQNLSFPETIAFLSIIPFYLFFAHKKLFWKEKLLNFYGVIGFLSVALGFILYFLLDPTRMTGPFFNLLYHANFWPNAFATFLIMIWPIYLLIYKKWNFVSILVLSFIIAGLFLTFSRGALIAGIGQIVLLGIYFARRIKLKSILIIISILLLSVFIFYFSNFARSLSNQTINVGERLAFQNNELMTSGQERKDFWIGAVELIKEKPFFGYGAFSFRYAFNSKQTIFLGSSDHPHNFFLKLGAEFGLINLFAFLGFLTFIFYTVLVRFRKLSKESKDFVFILSVCVLGVFAHSLIDYNFNFFQNLLLLFSLLFLIRSEVVINSDNPKRAFYSAFFVFVVFFACFYQFSIIFLSATSLYEKTDDLSLYIRYSYLDRADKLLSEKKFDESLALIDKQIELNPLDSKAYYLKGAIFCNRSFENRNLEECRNDFAKALELNPNNNIDYYRDYLRVLEELKAPERVEFREKCIELFNDFYYYTKFNVHFTAYTRQVESAIEMVEITLPHLEKERAKKIREKIVLMKQYAKEHRGGKTF